MDFGFDGFLAKFEEHCGKFWTKALVILMGIAAACFCLGIIWHYAVAPILQFIQAPGHLEVLGRIVLAGTAFGSGWWISRVLNIWYLNRKLDSRAKSREALDAQIKATEQVLAALDKREAERRARRERSSGEA